MSGAGWGLGPDAPGGLPSVAAGGHPWPGPLLPACPSGLSSVLGNAHCSNGKTEARGKGGEGTGSPQVWLLDWVLPASNSQVPPSSPNSHLAQPQKPPLDAELQVWGSFQCSPSAPPTLTPRLTPHSTRPGGPGGLALGGTLKDVSQSSGIKQRTVQCSI